MWIIFSLHRAQSGVEKCFALCYNFRLIISLIYLGNKVKIIEERECDYAENGLPTEVFKRGPDL